MISILLSIVFFQNHDLYLVHDPQLLADGISPHHDVTGESLFIVKAVSARRISSRRGHVLMDGTVRDTLIECLEQDANLLESSTELDKGKLTFVYSLFGHMATAESLPLTDGKRYLVWCENSTPNTKRNLTYFDVKEREYVPKWAIELASPELVRGANINETLFLTFLNNAAQMPYLECEKLMSIIVTCPQTTDDSIHPPYKTTSQLAQQFKLIEKQTAEIRFAIYFHLRRMLFLDTPKLLLQTIPKLPKGLDYSWMDEYIGSDPCTERRYTCDSISLAYAPEIFDSNFDLVDVKKLIQLAKTTDSSQIRFLLINSVRYFEKERVELAKLLVFDERRLQDVLLKGLSGTTRDADAQVPELLDDPQWQTRADKAIAYWKAKYKF